MPADAKFFTWDEFRSYVGAAAADRAFDDAGNGEADDAAVAQVFNETDQEVISHAVKNYPEKVAAGVTAATCHPTLKMLALRYAKAAAQFRAPTVFHAVDILEEMKLARASLNNLALGKTHLQGAEQSNARAEVVNGTTIGGSTVKTFGCFGDF